MKVLVIGSSGLIGSEAAEHFDRQGHEVVGVDMEPGHKYFRADAHAPYGGDMLDIGCGTEKFLATARLMIFGEL